MANGSNATQVIEKPRRRGKLPKPPAKLPVPTDLLTKLAKDIDTLRQRMPVTPWQAVDKLTTRLDKLITQLEKPVPGMPKEIINRLDKILTQLEAMSPEWKSGEPQIIYGEAIRSVGTFYTRDLIDCTKAKRVCFRVTNNLNQDVSIQPIGDIRNTRETASAINGPISCSADDRATIVLAWTDWHPFIGAKITVSTAPTSGRLSIELVLQE